MAWLGAVVVALAAATAPAEARAASSVSVMVGTGELEPNGGWDAERRSSIIGFAYGVAPTDSFPYELRYTRGEARFTSALGGVGGSTSTDVDLDVIDFLAFKRLDHGGGAWATFAGAGVRCVIGDKLPGDSTKGLAPIGVLRAERSLGARFALGASLELSAYVTSEALLYASFRLD